MIKTKKMILTKAQKKAMNSIVKVGVLLGLDKKELTKELKATLLKR